MPRGDRTGPAGMGPMTGRAAGYCAGYVAPGFVNPGRGCWGGGRGGGQGFRNRFYATGLTGWQRAGGDWQAWGNRVVPDMSYGAPTASAMTKEQEINALKGQAEYLAETLEGIRKRIEELETRKQ
jgi:hypothetical protein